MRDKLYTYGLHRDDVEELLSFLISEGFINEERYAKAFAGGRFRLKKWGRLRIERELVQKQISSYCIKKGLEEIGEDEYNQTLTDLINKKANTLSEENSFILKQRIATFAIGKGFESELVWNVLNDNF